jgi:nanoRNase/pAp phosphatase (c-di-AMP/oligoRNAs hydrolase)
LSRKGDADTDVYSRNIALAILTGMVGDSHMGKYLKSHKERRYYTMFSAMFDKLLIEKTNKNSHNIASMEAIFDAIQRFSVREKQCFDRILELRHRYGPIGYVCLDREVSAELFQTYGVEFIVNVSKAAADTLAEASGKLGLVAYFDDESLTGFVQFRLRRSAQFTTLDLREVPARLGIANGGGHPGAIGFRVQKADVQDIHAFTMDIASKIAALIPADG